MLLDAIKGRYDFPDLKNMAIEQYNYWEPETVIIEASIRQPLIHELRRRNTSDRFYPRKRKG